LLSRGHAKNTRSCSRFSETLVLRYKILYKLPAVHTEDFNYELPEHHIAKTPATPRDHSRLMLVQRSTGSTEDWRFFESGEALRPGDMLVVNDTKVFPARLFGKDSGGKTIEVLLLKRLEGDEWACLVKPGKKVRDGLELQFPEAVTGYLRRADA